MAPPSRLGEQSYGFLADGRVVCAYSCQGIWLLGLLCPDEGKLYRLNLPYVSYKAVTARGVGVIAETSYEAESFVHIDLVTEHVSVIKTAFELSEEVRLNLSEPISLSFGKDKSDVFYGLYYPPKNHNYTIPEMEKPPLIIHCHGGR